MRAVVSRVAFTNLSIHTVAESTSLRAVRNIADSTRPSNFTVTDIGFSNGYSWTCCLTMYTRRIADRSGTVRTFVTIEAFTKFRWRTYSENTFLADTKTANRTLPSLIALTCVGSYTLSLDTRRNTNWIITVKSRPPEVTLAALPSFIHICCKTWWEICETICCRLWIWLCCSIEQWISCNSCIAWSVSE